VREASTRAVAYEGLAKLRQWAREIRTAVSSRDGGDQQQLVDDQRHRQMLGDDDDPTALAGPHSRVPPQERGHDDLVEVGVRLEADHGYDASWVRRLAASFW
jgi:hypothetical protein